MTTARKLKAAADIGGTFTDITLMLEDGSIDIWGWTDETPDNEQEWRLTLRKYDFN